MTEDEVMEAWVEVGNAMQTRQGDPDFLPLHVDDYREVNRRLEIIFMDYLKRYKS